MKAILQKNEVDITIDGSERVMRATFSTICNIENELKDKLIPLIERLSAQKANPDGTMSVGAKEIATIIYFGLLGNKDSRLSSIDAVGEVIVRDGMENFIAPALSLLMVAHYGGEKLGKLLEAQRELKAEATTKS